MTMKPMNWINWIKQIVDAHTSDEADPPKRRSSIREAPPPAPLIDTDETLAGELTRARRYEQALTIVVATLVPLDESHDGRGGSNGNGDGGPDVLPLLAAVGLREALRESDVLCYRPVERRFVLGLPQTEGDEGRQAMARVGELFHRRLHIDLEAGVASFPGDGLTLEDLENKASGRAEAVGSQAQPASFGESPPSLQVSSQQPRNGSGGRPSRANSPSEVTHEALGGE